MSHRLICPVLLFHERRKRLSHMHHDTNLSAFVSQRVLRCAHD